MDKRVRDPEKTRKYQRTYREKHLEEERERGRKYNREHREARTAANKKWYENNPEKVKQYYQDNQKHIRARVTENGKQWRQKFLEMYGNACSCCGESEIEFLTIDHINGQKGVPVTKKERGIGSYRKACSEYLPSVYRTFCMNCNFATRHGQICPHQKESKSGES